MKASIKVLHKSEIRTSKKGQKYRKVLCLTTIDGTEFLETYYIFLK